MNTSTTGDEPSITSITFYALLGSVGILGNGLVLVVMISIKELRTTTNAFIINQSVIDMVTSILLFAMFIAPPLPVPEREPAADFVCAIWNSKYIFWAMTVASTFNLVLLTLERYVAVVFPVIYRNHFSNRRTPALAAVPWIIGFVYKIYWAVVNQHSNGNCDVQYTSPQLKVLAGCMTFLITFLLPLVIMAFAYSSIEKTLRQRVDNDAAESNRRQTLNANSTPNPPANHRERARVNVIKTLIIVSVTYAICWAPNHIIYLSYNLGKGENLITGPFYNFTVYLAFFNMCINPFIYTLKYRHFRKGLKKFFGLTQKSETPPSITASNISG